MKNALTNLTKMGEIDYIFPCNREPQLFFRISLTERY
jgi:hypothetical protein